MNLGHVVQLVESLRTSVKIICLLWMVLGILYILTLSKALKKCSAPSRTMRPGMVWLMLIPLFNIIWQFFVVLGLARSLGNEFQTRRIPSPQSGPGMSVGMAMSVCTVCAILPFLIFFLLSKVDNQSATTDIPTWAIPVIFLIFIGLLSALAHLVLWIIYWSKIASCSRMLDRNSAATVPPVYAPHA